MRLRHGLLGWLTLSATLFGGTLRADEATGIAFFEARIRPVLVEHCYRCHGAAANKRKGGLVVDSRDGLRRGGDTGPAVVAGRPHESLLLKAVRYDDPHLQMPPKGKLPAAVIADLETWIQQGAADPRGGDAKGKSEAVAWAETLRERKTWWSLQPVRQPAVPAVAETAWANDPIDRFVLAKLEEKGLRPAAPADRRTLARRLAFALTGLPPSAADVEAFVADPSPAAYATLVDRVMASPHFGERWARHWLDIVRFTETHGNEWNYEVHHAWRYRDYLTRAFNADVPFDQLIREHIAGDLLPVPRLHTTDGTNESVIGTAFWRFGEVNHDDCIEFRQLGFDVIDNQIDTFGKTFQGLTIACARCHDHKLDAVSTRDYHALLGILRGSRLVSHTIDPPSANADAKERLRGLKREIRDELARLWREDVDRFAATLSKAKLGTLPLEHPLAAWQALHGNSDLATAFAASKARFEKERRERAAFNAEQFVPFGDFATEWRAVGQGLADTFSGGDFAVAGTGDAALAGIYPAGRYTHLLSQRLNGAMQSPSLPRKKYVSFQVLGGKTAALRLVSNNCQLNYVNYRALTKADLHWQKFAVPADSDGLRTYAEIVTKLDNPKFPDQLGTLGGDTGNARVPWEQAAADPTSFFGIARAVAHDGEETPRPELDHLSAFYAEPIASEADLLQRLQTTTRRHLDAWDAGKLADADARWLEPLQRAGLLRNARTASPRLSALIAAYRQAETKLALPRIVPGLADGDVGYDQPILMRGDSRNPGAVVPHGYLEVLDAGAFSQHGSGRRELAERVASPTNPLTARVFVNRLWHHLFGSGLVRTVDNFGKVGDRPSHPELLDYLAARFVAEGWSIKPTIRALVLTQTFQMASRANDAGQAADPDNRLLHHYPLRRLEAEAIRDSVLAASGRLDGRLYGPSVHPYRAKANPDRRLFPGPLDGDGRRSLYLRVNLMEAPPFLGAFNLPGGKVAQGRRDVTNVPAQALALLNDPFVLQQADLWAGHLVERPDATPAERVTHLFQTALGRPPSAAERERFVVAVARFAELHGVAPGAVMTSRPVWHDLTHAMFNLKEFVYLR